MQIFFLIFHRLVDENADDKCRPLQKIVMKFDDPPESDENSSYGPILSQSKFGNSSGISEFSKLSSEFSGLKPSILRPSQFSTVSNLPGPSSKSLSDSLKTQSSFIKVSDKTIRYNDDPKDKNGRSIDSKIDTEPNKTEKRHKEDIKLATPKFLPLAANPKENNPLTDTIGTVNCLTSSFIFGQNIKDRVAVGKDNDCSEDETEKLTNEELVVDKSSELLFSNAAAVCSSTTKSGLTLSQAAHEVEEANRASKRKYNQVIPLTGEEEEVNILQINCKLFTFDKVTSGWKERGRGILRLNDRDEESRLVGRATGTQRLILNTKIWPEMTAERAGPKSLRLTAMDIHGDIRIFIVQAAPSEVDQLYNLLIQRLERAKENQPKKFAADH
ncbi:ran-binding protein 3 isoform X1 [Microplitis mediator]|uniref:ran-binding protein 3 isoform X1 n=1 Tax=Microplitis mediator TaxID=375433 RepID=UPI00255398A3|nr:ran-binding protein 3 isoform X1 [Microplitis mediator]